MNTMELALMRAGVVNETQVAESRVRAEEGRKEIQILEGKAEEAIRQFYWVKAQRDRLSRELEEVILKAENFIKQGCRAAYWRDVITSQVRRHDEAEQKAEEAAVELGVILNRLEALTGIRVA